MMLILLVLLTFLSSCVQRPQKVKRELPVYRQPVRGEVIDLGRGVFIRSRCDDFVRSVEAGRVVYAGKDLESFGWVVIVKQVDGFASVYGKLKKVWVRMGEKLKARQVIGRVGKSSQGCGVYYELRDRVGRPVKPVLRY